ncbi:MAG TPA: hypothetical protein VN851_04255 [Thermoanaerobaculia bacterium]|nr:hypothetical protein [Thermoanaerobaculia bacterium]
MSRPRIARLVAMLFCAAGFATLLAMAACASSPASAPASPGSAPGLLVEDPPPEPDPLPEEPLPTEPDPAPDVVKSPEDEVSPAPEPSPLGADTSCAWGSNWACNLCVVNVPGQFAALRDHGEPLGFKHDGLELNVAYPSSNHIEGIQRLLTGQGRTFVIAKRDDRSTGQIGLVVSMATRNGSGVRVRSNRLSTSIAQPEDTPPSGSDRVIATLPPRDHFRHAGGMQAAGNVVALPMEEGPGNGRIALYDFNSSTAPLPFAFIEGTTPAAGTASLAKLSASQWVLLLGHGDAKKLEVFKSSSGDLRAPGNRWTRTEIWEDWKVNVWDSFQNLNFVTDCNDGQLYLIGTGLGVRWGAIGSDYAHLYRAFADGPLRLEHVGVKQFYCSNDGSRQCNFDAGSGVFVGADHKLVLYATEHADDGPSDSVRLVEFRGTWPNLNCGVSLNEAFVDFYDDSNFSDRGFIFDYPDRFAKNWSNFGQIDAFNDKASSVRWCIPPGHRVRIYADSNYKGSSKDLVGNGQLQQVNLSSWSFNDKTSSAQWLAF